MTDHDDFRPGAGGVPSGDDRFLAGLRRAATGIEPDRHFADRLWADLSAPAPRLADPYGDASAERPADQHGRTDRRPSRPAGRARRLAGRVASPLTTVAAALVIALVGYGALSLSGTAPGALFERGAPNASAEGQAMADHPIVGTWAIRTTTPFGFDAIPMVMTFDAGGGLMVSHTFRPFEQGIGTWATSDAGEVTFDFTMMVTQDFLEETFEDEAPWYPQFARQTGTARPLAEGGRWAVRLTGFDFVLWHNDGSGDLGRLPLEGPSSASPAPVNDEMEAIRMDELIDDAPLLTAAEASALESSRIDPLDASPVASPQLTAPTLGPSAIPTPTVAPTQAVPTPTPG
jgi:hypothetical protein